MVKEKRKLKTEIFWYRVGSMNTALQFIVYLIAMLPAFLCVTALSNAANGTPNQYTFSLVLAWTVATLLACLIPFGIMLINIEKPIREYAVRTLLRNETLRERRTKQLTEVIKDLKPIISKQGFELED